MSNQRNDLLKDFIDGNKWKSYNITQSPNILVLPLIIYFDDFETVNCLGSRRGMHKLGSVMACLKCFHPQFNSQLKNLFLTLLFYSENRAVYGNENIFRPLVEEIKFLQRHGIIIKLE